MAAVNVILANADHGQITQPVLYPQMQNKIIHGCKDSRRGKHRGGGESGGSGGSGCKCA